MQWSSLDEYCGPNAKIIHSPFFEKAVVKILNGDEKSLTTEEAQSVQKLKKKQVVEQPEGSNSQDSDSDFASLLIKKTKTSIIVSKSVRVRESKIFTAYFEYSGTVF